MKNDNVRLFLWMVFAIVVVSFIFSWSTEHDKGVLETADRYEMCVKKVYQMTPSQYYEVNGEFPQCEFPKTDFSKYGTPVS